MISFKETSNCIGIETNGNISVLRDMLGFWRHTLPREPETLATTSISLRDTFSRLNGDYVNIIKIGGDQFEDFDHEQIDYCIYRIRNIFWQAIFNIGHINHYSISVANADGLDLCSTGSDMREILRRWRGDNDAIWAFVPRIWDMGDLLGRAPSRRKMIFGLQSDDGEDDTDSIRNVFLNVRKRNQGTTIFFPAGTYLIRSFKKEIT